MKISGWLDRLGPGDQARQQMDTSARNNAVIEAIGSLSAYPEFANVVAELRRIQSGLGVAR